MSVQRERIEMQFGLELLLQSLVVLSISIFPAAFLGVRVVPISVWIAVVGLLAILRLRGAAVAAAIFGSPLLILYVVPLFEGPAHPDAFCRNNLRLIGLATLNYESTHGHFPPPYTTDEYGRRLHSWRVLLLPFLEEQELYEAIDLAKPWNHPDNLKLASLMPDVSKCPNDPSPFSARTTTYVAVVGDNTAWSTRKERTVSDFVDGMRDTVLVIESAASRTHWMAPFDPTFESIVPAAADGSTLLLPTAHSAVSNCVFCDGHVKPISSDSSAEDLRALTTVDGAEDESTD